MPTETLSQATRSGGAVVRFPQIAHRAADDSVVSLELDVPLAALRNTNNEILFGIEYEDGEWETAVSCSYLGHADRADGTISCGFTIPPTGSSRTDNTQFRGRNLRAWFEPNRSMDIGGTFSVI